MKRCLKFTAIITALFLLFSALPVFAGAQTENTNGYYTYVVSDGIAVIIDVDTSISGDIVIPATLGGYTVGIIGFESFRDCLNITGVTIPNGVTEIYESAFSCTGIAYINIPKSVIEIRDFVFDNCTRLENITVDEKNPNYSSLGGVLFNKDKTELVRYPIGNKAHAYTIPNSVTKIGNTAFSGGSNLFGVTIPNSVTAIGPWVFSGCTGITSIKIPNSVTKIGNSAFSGCSNLTNITLPDSIESLEDYLFYDCTGIESIIVPDSVKYIKSSVFDGCSNLESITLPKSLTSVGRAAFLDCTSIKTYGTRAIKQIKKLFIWTITTHAYLLNGII